MQNYSAMLRIFYPLRQAKASNLPERLIRKQVHAKEPAPVTDNSEDCSTPTKQANISFFFLFPDR